MEDLTKAILKNAEAEAETLVKEARQKQQQVLGALKNRLKSEIEEAIEGSQETGRQEAAMNAAKIRRNVRGKILEQELEVFNELKSAIRQMLAKNPKGVFEAAIKEGKKQFKNPQVEVGTNFAGLLKQMNTIPYFHKGP